MYEQEFVKSLYIQLYRIRHFETECIKLYRQGLIRGYFHPYLGEEAIAVGTCAALEPSDYITSTHRGHGHCIAKGAELKYMVAELLGKKTGYCFGLGGSMHIADLSKGNLGANAIVGANVPLGVGAALASSLMQNHRVTAVFTSDGGSNNGVFAESLNLAAIWNLPMILVLENNQYAVSTPISESTRQPELYKRGKALGIDSVRIDGNDVFQVYEKIKQSAKKCRQGKGPVLIEMLTYRHGGHHVNDPGTYMPREKLDYFLSIDPVKRCKTYLLETVGATEQVIADIESDVHKEMHDAIEFGKKSEELSQDEFLELIQDY
jgi:pyruvate dehydrogenase E1 component alpha subunit